VAKVLKKKHPHLRDKKGQVVAYTDEKGESTGFRYVAFGVPHDSNGGCFGYSFFLDHATGPRKITIATDIGFVEPGHTAHFADSDIIIIESNHDVKMLADSPRPRWLKDRITNEGHLSNDQAGEFIAGVIGASANLPAAIVLAHISQECNTNARARERMRCALEAVHKPDILIVETYKEKISAVVSV